jgi:hypothetical protein
MMTSKRLSWFACVDYGARPQHAWCLDVAGINAGKRESSRDESPRSAFCNDSVAFMNGAGRSAGAARSSHGAVVGILSARDLVAQAHTPGPIDLWPREQSAAHERAEPLPAWMRTMRPSQTGMFMPGLLIALAALGAANGILSTVLALTWL